MITHAIVLNLNLRPRIIAAIPGRSDQTFSLLARLILTRVIPAVVIIIVLLRTPIRFAIGLDIPGSQMLAHSAGLTVVLQVPRRGSISARTRNFF